MTPDTLTQCELDEMLRRLEKLDALEAAGVDNWEGYDFAMEELWARDDD